MEDVLAGDRRREDVVELGEEHQRRREREPAVEVLAVGAEAQPEADERDAARAARAATACRSARTGWLEPAPAPSSGSSRPIVRKTLQMNASAGTTTADGDQERTAARRRPARGRTAPRRSAPRASTRAASAGPGLDGPQRRSAEHGNDGEDERSDARRPESRQQRRRSSRRPSTTNRTPARIATIAADERDRRVEHEPRPRAGVGVLQLRLAEKQRRRGAEQRDEQDLAEQPGAVGVARRCSAPPPNRQARTCR